MYFYNIKFLIIFLTTATCIASCTHTPTESKYRSPLAQWSPSANYNARQPVVIVLHGTEQESAQQSLQTLKTSNNGGKVSAHYLIADNGTIYQLVEDDKRAWHAGSGRWGKITDLNSASIGIELDNDGNEPYSEQQIDALLRLLDDVCTRLNIPRTQIVAHSDTAPTRKRDPGPLFPWKTLAEHGFGLWPQGELINPPADFNPWLALSALGYALDDRNAAVRAFHLRFRGIADDPDQSSLLDAEDHKILYALVTHYRVMPSL